MSTATVNPAGGNSAAPAADACCAPSQGEAILKAEEAEALALRFKALSDPNRLRILSIVSTSEAAETCVCDLPEPLGLKQPTVSHHLKILVEAGILHREKRGVWAYYSVVPGALESLGSSLAPKG
ncbi:ArsR/SmtB family transcription factor [Micrococcus antarcticus]